MFPLVLLLLQLTQVYSLECYQCLDVRNTSECHNTVTCPPDHLCFTEASGTGDQLRFNLTCKGKQDCPTTTMATTPSSLIVGLQTTVCAQCCATLGCNHYLCSAGTQSITSTSKCHDDETFDCQRMSGLFNICADVHHAKTVCRKFCGLCDLVDGGWSSWSPWSFCDVTCGNGTVYRSRPCTNPSPAHGGLDCQGSNKQTSACHLQACPVAGGWSAWSPWESCSVSCGVGLQRRDRSCSNPYPGRFGDHCFGDNTVYKTCFDRACSATNGAWSAWSPWGACSATCNAGLQSRTRTCSNPPPSQFGRDCSGTDVDKQICNSQSCAVSATNGAWSDWSNWGACSATCNGGLQSRTRSCANPTPTQFGRDCSGTDIDKRLCNSKNCPEKAVAFSVHSPNGSLVSSSPIFTHTLVNTGHYNQATGKFTCPVAGVYMFSATLAAGGLPDTSDVYCNYQVNGTNTASVRSYHDAWDTSSGNLVVALHVGDVVDLDCYGWYYVWRNFQTTYSGVLITPT